MLSRLAGAAGLAGLVYLGPLLGGCAAAGDRTTIFVYYSGT